jgi:hypothetical protein
MGLSGAAIVFRDEVSRTFSLEWLVRFHSEFLLGEIGRIVNESGESAQSPASIFRFLNHSTLYFSSIAMTDSRTPPCSGFLSYILQDSACLLGFFGVSWDLYLPSSRSLVFSYAAAASSTTSQPVRIGLLSDMKPAR